MKLGITDNPVEIQFAQNKIEDLCVNFEAMAPFLAPSSEELATDSARTQSMEGRDDPCKFWACEGLSSDRCEQYDKSWANWAVWLVQRHSTFAECVADCDCPIGETKYTASKEGQFLITCCDDATEEIRLNNFGTPEAISDASTGGWKLECKPKCLAPECGKWYCKGGGIPGVNEVGCSQWTDGESTPPEGVDFYNDQSVCEQQSKCGKWWCNGSGVCQPITQENPNPSSEENWGGAYFDDPTQCQNWGCGKYYCGLLSADFDNVTPECFKVDGVNTLHQQEESMRLIANYLSGGLNPQYLFESESECEGSCGKYFCPGLGSGFTPTVEAVCGQVITTTDKSSYGEVFDNLTLCGYNSKNGCALRWSCGANDCASVFYEETTLPENALNTYYDTQLSCCQACNDCSGRECPAGQIYNPIVDQCVNS